MIEFKDITKKYEDIEILKNTNYTFREEGLVCLLGTSGSGKTTLLNMLAGFDTDYEGNICVDDRIITFLNENELCSYRRESVGFIFQDYHLLKGYTVLENIILPCDLYDDEKKLEKAEKLLKMLGIENKKNEKIENLSGGQKQRVAIARALIKEGTILLADEPTGALDRKTSNEIMKILKEIAKDILVVVITHDEKVCDFADEIIEIKDKNINIIRRDLEKKEKKIIEKKKKNYKGVNCIQRAKKNFKVHIKQFTIVAIVIALGIISFMLSMSSKSIMQTSIEKFKEKNTAFNNGYVKGEDKDNIILNILNKEKNVENIYYQHKLENIDLEINNNKENLKELIPMPKAKEKLSYGTMPRRGKDEIAITPSFAKKFSKDIKELVGKKVEFKIGNYEKILKVSGIYNAEYDSLFLSSDIEKEIYEKVKHDEKVFSISYDVKEFEGVCDINNLLEKNNIESVNASAEVKNLVSTFESINKLFLMISIIIFLISLAIGIVLLSRLQKSRIKEIGLLAALGFTKKQIRKIILNESILLGTISVTITFVFFTGYLLISKIFSIDMEFNKIQLGALLIIVFLIISLISGIINSRLTKIEPAKALKL